MFSKHFTTTACDVEEMESLGALAGLGLGESGANGVSFDSREFDNTRVTFRNLSVNKADIDESSFSAATAVFHCAKMGEEAPNFDRLDFTDISIKDGDENVEITAKTLNIARPSPEAARSIINNMTQLDTDSVNDGGFGAVSITDLKMKSDEMVGSLDALSWGESRNDEGVGRADLTVGNLNLVIANTDGGKDMTVDFEGMNARNLNIGRQLDTQSSLSSEDMVENILGGLNSFEKPYDEFLIEPLTISSEGFSLKSGGMEGKTSEKGKVITTRQNLKPTAIILNPALGENPSFAQQYGILKSLDLDSLDISGSSVTTLNSETDSMAVSDGLFVIDDVFRLNFEYGAEGVSEMISKMQTLAGNNNPNGEDLIAAYETLKLNNFRFTLEDNSIVDKGLKLATEMTGQSEKNIKLMLTGAVFFAASQAKNELQAEVYAETVESFSDFVKKGGTLTIEANPPAPFALAPLFVGQGEGIDPATLGFSASQANTAE